MERKKIKCDICGKDVTEKKNAITSLYVGGIHTTHKSCFEKEPERHKGMMMNHEQINGFFASGLDVWIGVSAILLTFFWKPYAILLLTLLLPRLISYVLVERHLK